jgi:hypothetical protein
MTQTFRFGDMVKSRMHPNKTLGLVVDAGSNQYSYIIRWEHTKGVSQEHTESLELIPHPDTVRLDWLADRDNHIGNVQLPAECVAGNLHSMRDAIDMAMQMDKENTGTQEKDA